MVNKRWSKKAYQSLKDIFEFHKEEKEYARRVVKDIVQHIDQLKYPKQYQVDELIGPPYRRIIIKNYRIVYKIVDSENIEILQIFDNRQSPQKIRKDFKK